MVGASCDSDPVGVALADGLPLWDPERDDALVVRQIRQETHDVKTFVLSPAKPARFRYRPGQFLTLDLEIGGEAIHRCYTISSTPTRPGTISITVKRVPGGPVSNFLHDTLKLGSVLHAVGPMGEFTFLDHPPAAKYLFLSGGSGITPLMSMTRALHDLADPRDVVFLHHARSPADIIFRRELDLIAGNLPNFRFVPVVEGDSPAERWHGFTGRISRALLDAAVPDFREREIFVCGPSPYMAAVRTILGDAGFPMAHHHEESFNFAELSASLDAGAAEAIPAPASAAKTFHVTFSKTNREVDCPSDMFVLEAARQAGMRLPSSCTKGLCGTCKCKLVSGEVEMKHAGGIRQREIDAGMILICCSTPKTDLIIER